MRINSIRTPAFLLLISLALGSISIVLDKFGQPYTIRGIFCSDNSIRYPYMEDTIPYSAVVCSGLAIDAIIVILAEIVLSKLRKSDRVDLLLITKNILVLLFSFVLVQLSTQLIKFFTGRLRPHFREVCHLASCTELYEKDYVCQTQNHKRLRESRLSFPSAHASAAAHLASFGIFFFHIKIRTGSIVGKFISFAVQTLILVGVAAIGISRVNDNNHHPSDVLAGFILGLGIAYFASFGIVRELNAPKKSENN